MWDKYLAAGIALYLITLYTLAYFAPQIAQSTNRTWAQHGKFLCHLVESSRGRKDYYMALIVCMALFVIMAFIAEMPYTAIIACAGLAAPVVFLPVIYYNHSASSKKGSV